MQQKIQFIEIFKIITFLFLFLKKTVKYSHTNLT